MGLGPKQPLHPILVDPDSGNGNLNRTIELITKYKAIHEQISNPEKVSFFNTKIVYSDQENIDDTRVRIPNIFNPNSDLALGMNKLSNFIEYDTRLTGTDSKYLADLLFSSDELNMDMAQGYRGVPSIGSVLMTNVQMHEFWPVLTSSLKSDPSSKVFVFASVFGGTGASGYPVISQLLKNEAPNSKVGGALVLPYFKLQDPNDLINQQPALRQEKILPNSNSFMINAKAACEFYQNNFSRNDSNYVLGDDMDNCAQHEEYHLGSREQKNDAHMIEVMAAYAALDFWGKDGNNYKSFYELQVKNPIEEATKPTEITAEDIPHTDKGKPFEKFALLSNYIEDLYKLIDKPDPGLLDKIAWLRGLKHKGKDMVNEKAEVKKLKDFCDCFKTWINQNHSNTANLSVLNSKLELGSLVSSNIGKYSKYHIDQLDTNLDKIRGEQSKLLGSMIEVLSKAINKKVGK